METETRLRIPIPNEVYAERRENVLHSLSNRQMAVIQAKPTAGDITHVPVFDRNLTYLVPHFEQSAAIVFAPGFKGGEQILFVEPNNPVYEQWLGRKAGIKGAKRDYDMENVRPLAELEELLKGQLRNRDVVDITHSVLPEMRMIKDKHEIELLRQAGKATAYGFNMMLNSVRYGLTGHQVRGQLEGWFAESGGHGIAFPTIVVSGPDVCILHGAPGPEPIQPGRMVLVDAGATVWGYASDMTSTFPSNVRFTKAQDIMYSVLEEGMEAALENIRPGLRLLDSYNASSMAMIEQAIEADIIKRRDPKRFMESNARRVCIPHGPSHWIGLSVHDEGAYSADYDNTVPSKLETAADTPRLCKDRVLEPGMVISCEPGFYVPSTAGGALSKEFLGLGGRIEVTVLVTDGGHEVLNPGVPWKVEELYRAREKAYRSGAR
jgi:Xaa-Pro aminopeptidase